jgi:hypothetical protein
MELKKSMWEWEVDEFPTHFEKHQIARIVNNETMLMNKVTVRLIKLDAKFSAKFDAHTSFPSKSIKNQCARDNNLQLFYEYG